MLEWKYTKIPKVQACGPALKPTKVCFLFVLKQKNVQHWSSINEKLKLKQRIKSCMLSNCFSGTITPDAAFKQLTII